MFKNFTKINEDEKRLILGWRNSDRIRTKMVHKEIISWEDHNHFIECLKGRKDCIYYLIYIDDVPVAVSSIIDINLKNKTCSGGMYIGDVNYLGYGIPILYYGYKNIFENMNIIEHEFDVLKTNKRVYKMHKEVFHAKDKMETDKEWFLFHNQKTYQEMKKDLDNKMIDYYNINNVVRFN
jgi:UDP-4-amino-4,6-dideoxy-N-acetyl-beta-L-altrosamine N-acetyltransferase